MTTLPVALMMKAESEPVQVRFSQDPKAMLDRYGQSNSEVVGLAEQFAYRREEGGRVVMEFGDAVGVVESDLSADHTIHRWSANGGVLKIPLHWHRQDEWIICLEGNVHLWGKELSTCRYWEVDMGPHQHVHLPAFKAHAIESEGIFLALWTPRHPFVLAGD